MQLKIGGKIHLHVEAKINITFVVNLPCFDDSC